ncbi:MAG: hypothetical protein ABSA42_04255 [Terracidiphilus sp.]|jgi:hypothetical protein
MAGTAIKSLAILLALLPLTVIAQNNNAASAGSPGCGDDAVKFSVKTGQGQNLAQPDAGKAVVYFIEDDSNFESSPKPTTRAGLDGKWVGATHGNSYLYFSVDPAVHHLCASWQLGVILGKGRKTAAVHFTAEAGGVYYFEVKNIFDSTKYSETLDMSFIPLDSDEGQLLVNKFALSTSRQKK